MNPPSPFLPARMWRTPAVIAAIAVASVLAACSFTRPVTAKRTFLLEPAAPPMAAVQKLVSVRVGLVNVAAPYRGKAFVYRQGDMKFDADYYNEFFVAPTAMLSEATSRALATANVFRRVIPPGATDAGDFVLDGFVSELYGDLREPGKPVAAVAITYYLLPAVSIVPNVVWSKEYVQRVPVAEATPDGFARAWNTALTAILADLARDLAAAELPK